MKLFDRFKQESDAAAVSASATELIDKFGDQAYYQARDREKGCVIYRPHSASHWRRVALEIAAAKAGRLAFGPTAPIPLYNRYIGAASDEVI